MGASQSTSSDPTPNEELLTRLRTLRLEEGRKQDGITSGYVHVEKEGDGKLCFDGPSLTGDAAKEWEKQLLSDPKAQLALGALLSNPLKSIVQQSVAILPDQQVFNLTIPFEGAPVTNQRSSGRCWLFATTNVFRIAVMKKHNLKEFELSQAYLFFWDKMEKANYFLAQIVDTADEDLSERLVQQLLESPVSDGGQWDMALNLVKKYGLVPQALYPDSYNAQETSSLLYILTAKLREDALKLRALVKNEKTTTQALSDAKAVMMREVHTILTLMLGPPPKPDETFKWEYYDANGKFHCTRMTPVQLTSELSTPTSVRQLSVNFRDMFSLVNDPRHKYMTKLTVERLNNVIEGNPIQYINVDMTTMKRAAIAMLKAGLPVWFGSDVGQFSNSVSGIMDMNIYDYGLAFNISLGMNKAQRLQTKESSATHAMVLTAVHIEDGKPVRWRVMNSWGDTAGTKGYFVMSDQWMDEFVYQIITDPSHVSQAVRDVMKQEPMVLPLWDPLGVLA